MAKLNRDLILREAQRVFARHGFRKTSLEDIARPLGVTKAALYYHFPGGKMDIIDASFEQEEKKILLAMRQAVDEARRPEEKLRCALLAKIEHIRSLRRTLDLTGEVNRELKCLYEDHERQFLIDERKLFEEILELGERRGVFRKSPEESLSRGIQLVATQLVSTLIFEDDPEIIRKRLDEMLDILFFGIMKRS